MRPFIQQITTMAALSACAAVSPAAFGSDLPAPSGWSREQKAEGTVVFTPPDLKPGEVYKLAISPSLPLNGKTLKDWLVAYAGPVGTEAGKLHAPLKVKVVENRGVSIVSGTGVYQGPNNTALGVIFLGATVDGGKNLHVQRILFSMQDGLLARYNTEAKTLTSALIDQAKEEAGSNRVIVPMAVAKSLKRGGALVPGVYTGTQYRGKELGARFRLYLYPDGEYRLCDQNDKDLEFNTGNIDYNPNSGQITIGGSRWELANSRIDSDTDFCYYGRDAANKPTIYAENYRGWGTVYTTLHYAGPAGKRLSPRAEADAKHAADAEAKRYKYVTAPGKGVAMSQIAGVLHHYDVQLYSAGAAGMGTNITDEAYLLLKDGTVHDGLPVAPDQLDIALSRRREPEKWGRWKQEGNRYRASWGGKQFQTLKGKMTLPGTQGTRLQGHWKTGSSSASLAGSSYRLWGVAFAKSLLRTLEQA